MSEITEESIRRLALRIQQRDRVSPAVAQQRAAKWAANKMLEGQPPKFDPDTKTYIGKHKPSVVCQCSKCTEWRDGLAGKSAFAQGQYNSQSGSW